MVCQLRELISCDDLNVETEEQVYEAVVKWVRFDLSGRRKHIAEVSLSYLCHLDKLPQLMKAFCCRLCLESVFPCSQGNFS